MSQPTTTSSTSTKRSSSSASLIFPAIKNAKSQAVVDGNKNGQQQITPPSHVHFAEPPSAAHNSSMMIEDDPIDEASPSSRSLSVSAGGITANLSRKKATPPQPTKKLVKGGQ